MATVIYEYELPDGRILEMEGDDSWGEEEAIKRAQAQYPDYFPKQKEPNKLSSLGYDEYADLPVAGAKEITPRAAAEIGAMGLGGIIGGPVGAAGGYALTDQLFKKYQDGQEITPEGAVKSLGMGALYELLPKGVLMGMGRMLPAKFERLLAEKSLGIPVGFSEDALQRAITTQLDNKLVLRGKDLNKVMKEVSVLKKEVNRIIQEAANNGVMIDPANVVDHARRQLLKQLDDVELSKPARDQAAGFIDEALSDYGQMFGTRPGTQLPNDMSILTAQKRKEATQKHSQRVYNKAVRTNSQVKDPDRFEAGAALASGLRKEIAEAAPDVVPLNKQMSDYLAWKDHAASRLRKQSKKGLISHDISLPFAIEMAARGKPGVATASGIVRNLAANPYVLSRLANGARTFRTNRGGAVPPAVLTKAFEEYWRQNQGGE